MPPKVKAKAKPKAKAKAAVKAKAKAGLGRGGGHRRRGALRRPGHREAGEGSAVESYKDRWAAGQTIPAHEVDVLLLGVGEKVAMEKAYYYQKECKLAGELKGVNIQDGEVTMKLQLTGTTHEGVLKLQSGSPELLFRVHRCGPSCTQEETADDMAHVTQMRKIIHPSTDEGWVQNLEKVARSGEHDDLQVLRERQRGLSPLPAGFARRWRSCRQSRGRRKEEEEKEKRGEKEKGRRSRQRRRGSPQRLTLKDSQPEGSQDPLPRNRVRSQRESEDESLSSGQKVCEAQRKEVIIVDKVFVKQRRGRERRVHRSCSRSGVPELLEGEAGCRRISRGTGSPGADPDEISPIDRDRSRGQTGSPPRSGPSLLPPDAPGQGVGSGSKRAVDHCHGGGWTPGWEGSKHSRSSHPTDEVKRIDYLRKSLECQPEAGSAADGAPADNSWSRAAGSQARHLYGLQAAPRGWPTRWPPSFKPGQRSTSERRRERRTPTAGGKERRQRSELQGRSDQEAEGGGSKRRQMTGLCEERRSGVQPLADDTGVRPLVEATGDLPLRQEGAGVAPRYEAEEQPMEERDYKEGVEAALCPLSGSRSPAAPKQEAAEAQSVHVSSAKPEAENSFGDAAVLPECAATAAAGAFAAFVMTPDRDASREKISELSSLTGISLGKAGHFLVQKLLEVIPLRSQSTGSRNPSAMFPLPTSNDSFRTIAADISPEEISWARCVTMSLNSIWGAEIFNDQAPNKVQGECLQGLLKDVRHFCSLDAQVEVVDWSEFFRIRSIDYKGDEVRVARWFSWKNISPALPREIGRVPLEDLCSQGARHYVLNFDHYLRPRDEWGPIPRPKVMVDDCNWGTICKGLVETGLCTFIEEHEVFDTGQGPLLNGLFGVTKDEWTSDGVEVYRLIMNLVPLNSLCQPLSGDVDTLPAWSGMSPFFLQPSQTLLVSSEDVKCFFYTLSVPMCWTKFLAFNKCVPEDALPSDLKGKKVYVASRVLPMGFLNSVSLAQHVHRTLVGLSGSGEVNAPEQEHRKDRPVPTGSSTWRVYLDNYDILEKVEGTNVVDMEGTTPPGVLALRAQYEQWHVPRNLKKAVERSTRCEVQGATVDGVRGIAFPRETKLAKYFSMALALSLQGKATQKQWQVACGCLVYFTMFRRPLLGGLNRVWSHIEEYNAEGPWYRDTPEDCKLEVLRFLGCLPLARLDFRLGVHPQVTCSDASTSGGGLCVSRGTTPYKGSSSVRGPCEGSFLNRGPETASLQ